METPKLGDQITTKLGDGTIIMFGYTASTKDLVHVELADGSGAWFKMVDGKWEVW